MTSVAPATQPDLLRGAAHLLRTPLGVILGMVTTLRDYDERFTSEQRSHYLGEVLQAADEMRVALDGLSLLSRVLHGTIGVNPSEVALVDVARTAAAALGGVWSTAVPVVPSGVTGSARADADRLGQAFDALARVFAPGVGVAMALTEDGAACLDIGPVQVSAGVDEIARLIDTPLRSPEANESVGRPGGWAVLLARHLIEAQGGALSLVATGTEGGPVDTGMTGAGMTLRVRLASGAVR